MFNKKIYLKVNLVGVGFGELLVFKKLNND